MTSDTMTGFDDGNTGDGPHAPHAHTNTPKHQDDDGRSLHRARWPAPGVYGPGMSVGEGPVILRNATGSASHKAFDHAATNEKDMHPERRVATVGGAIPALRKTGAFHIDSDHFAGADTPSDDVGRAVAGDVTEYLQPLSEEPRAGGEFGEGAFVPGAKFSHASDHTRIANQSTRENLPAGDDLGRSGYGGAFKAPDALHGADIGGTSDARAQGMLTAKGEAWAGPPSHASPFDVLAQALREIAAGHNDARGRAEEALRAAGISVGD